MLTIFESVLDLLKPAEEALKKTGKSDLCLEDDDVELLQQLCEFLRKFKVMSDLVKSFIDSVTSNAHSARL